MANNNDAFIPELWAMEGVEILQEEMVMASLVHRDFENEIRMKGDIVNTRKPSEFNTRRKQKGVDITVQDAEATNIQVPLDQELYVSFEIDDNEASKSFQELIPIYLRPAMMQLGRSADRALLGRIHELLGTPSQRVGKLGGMTSATAKDYILAARDRLNTTKAHQEGRNLVVSSASESSILATELFIKANERGDGGDALEMARMGRILGFSTFMDQNVNSVTDDATDRAEGTVTNALAAGGSGSQVVAITGYEVIDGEYATVAGNDQPTFITASTAGAGDTTAVTLNEANKFATLAGAVIKVYKAAVVDGAYAIGYDDDIKIDGFGTNLPPQTGQLIAFGTGASRRVYTIIDSWAVSTTQHLILDRPLAVALADDDSAFPGPSGSFNLSFHRNSIAMVNRPLVLPADRNGVSSAVSSGHGVSMRVTMQYDIKRGATVVKVDMLMGVAVLDSDLSCVILG